MSIGCEGFAGSCIKIDEKNPGCVEPGIVSGRGAIAPKKEYVDGSLESERVAGGSLNASTGGFSMFELPGTLNTRGDFGIVESKPSDRRESLMNGGGFMELDELEGCCGLLGPEWFSQRSKTISCGADSP